ncbi:MAG: acyltransferase [Lachnospiraceae bacterium]|nr:acyltransferase [Lachnospiraceae bacterium]
MGKAIKTRNQSIDIARVIFYTLIILGHSKELIQPTEPNFKFVPTAFLGVEFFFMVSGFLMAKRVLGSNQKIDCNTTFSFIKHKFSALLPYYAPAFILSFVFYHVSGSSLKQIFNHACLSVLSFFQFDIFGFDAYQTLAVTWYLSAMFTAMLFLYPLLCKFGNKVCTIIAPAICLFLYGWMAKEYGNLCHKWDWTGFVNVGLLRGFCGVSAGCICYSLSTVLKEKKLSSFKRICLTLFELLVYLYIIASMIIRYPSKYDFVTVLFIGVFVVLSFSEQSYLTEVINKILNKEIGNKGFSFGNFAGKFAMGLFFSDVPARQIVAMIMPNDVWADRFVADLIIVVILAFVFIFIGFIIDKIKKKTALNKQIL